MHHIKESIVAFESVLFPGHFLSVDGPGRIAVLEPIDHRVTGFTVLRVQFIVRVKVRHLNHYHFKEAKCGRADLAFHAGV